MVRGTRVHAEALPEGIAAVLATVGLRLSADKTLITHIAWRRLVCREMKLISSCSI
jgi:hypothetical protein